MVACLTRDGGALGLSLTGVTVVSLSKTLILLSTGSTQEDPPDITEKLLTGT